MSLINYQGASGENGFQILILFILFIVVLYQGSFINKLIVIVHFFVMSTLAEIFIALLMNLIVGLNQSTDINSFVFSIALIFSNTLVFAITFIYIKFLEFIKHFTLPRYTWAMLILHFTTSLLIVNIKDYYVLLEKNSSMLFILIGLFLSNIILLIVFINFIKKLNIENELKLEKYKQKYSHTKYSLLDQQYRNTFNLLHEILHKCNKINNQVKTLSTEEISTELKELTNLAFTEFNSVYSNSVIINTLVNNRLNILKENNIAVKSTITYNNFEFIDFCDQIDLFSNILDYAIENTIKSKKVNTIIIKSSRISDQIIIRFQFANNESMNFEKDSSNLINSILQKYNATLSILELDDHILSIIIKFSINFKTA